jgi:hypothetical protein
MFRSVTNRSVRYVLLSLVYLPVILGPMKATADDHAQMIQFELTFGGKQSVSNLYISMTPSVFSSQYETDGVNTIQVPVISSDTQKTTLLRPLTKLYANDETESSDGVTSEELNPVAGVGAAVIMLAGVAVLLLPFALAGSDAARSLDDFDPCRDGACNIDLPDPSDVPTISMQAEQ